MAEEGSEIKLGAVTRVNRVTSLLLRRAAAADYLFALLGRRSAPASPRSVVSR
jgi:hypothetical protein